MGQNTDVIDLSGVILLLWVFPIPGATCPLEWFFHRPNVLLVGNLAGASLLKWIVGEQRKSGGDGTMAANVLQLTPWRLQNNPREHGSPLHSLISCQ